MAKISHRIFGAFPFFDNYFSGNFWIVQTSSKVQSVMLRSQISGAGRIFRGKPAAGSWRPAKCHRTAIANSFQRSHITASTARQDFKYKKPVSQDVCKAAVRWKLGLRAVSVRLQLSRTAAVRLLYVVWCGPFQHRAMLLRCLCVGCAWQFQ